MITNRLIGSAAKKSGNVLFWVRLSENRIRVTRSRGRFS